MSLHKPHSGVGYGRNSAAGVCTNYGAGSALPRCSFCGKLGISYEHIEQCASEAATMNAVGRMGKARGATGRGKLHAIRMEDL